ncbi:MAG: hypothetical protein JWO46_346 [Nocardioidaceae bacterium]|nr:hypothetical protein [Nocardioidaceae bacterium]
MGKAEARGRTLRPDRPTLLLLVLLVGAGGYLLLLARSLWFFGDDWDFLLHRGLTGGERSLLQPHNEHWSTLPIVAYRVLFHVAGLRHYLAYAALPIAVHLVSVALLYLLLRRLGTRPWVALVALAPMLVLGAGAEDLLWDFQVGFLGPLPFALLAVLVLLRPVTRVSTLAVWVLLVAGLMCSGVGITMVFWVTVFTWARESLRRAVVVGVVPAVVYVAWYLRFGDVGPRAPTPSVGDFLVALARGVDSVWSEVLKVPGSGSVVVLALLVVVLRSRVDAPLRALALSGLAALVPFYGLIAFTRAGLADDRPTVASRYVYLGVVLTLPALAMAIRVVADRLQQRRRTSRVVGVVFVLAVLVVGVLETRSFHADREVVIGSSRDVVVGAATLATDGATLLSDHPDPTYAPDLTTELLTRPDVRAALPRDPSRAAELEASGALQVGTSPSGLTLPVAPRVRLLRVSAQPATGDGCTTGVAQRQPLLVLPATPTGSKVRLTVEGRGVATVLAKGSRRSGLVQRVMAPGVPTWIGTSAPGGSLRVHLPPGGFTVCTGAAS